MEIDVTEFFRNAGMIDYSASAMEIGQDAGRVTWEAACDDSEQFLMLDTDEKREAFRDHIKGFGAWTQQEIESWDDTELNALCMQMVAGDVREAEKAVELDRDEWTAECWDEYYAIGSEGRISSRLTLGDDGRIYYSLGE